MQQGDIWKWIEIRFRRVGSKGGGDRLDRGQTGPSRPRRGERARPVYYVCAGEYFARGDEKTRAPKLAVSVDADDAISQQAEERIPFGIRRGSIRQGRLRPTRS